MHKSPKFIVITSDGRRMLRRPHHPNANKNGQIPRAHAYMEKMIGRYLDKGEIVHHKDLNPSNDRFDNLQLMKLGDHVRLHNSLKERETDGRFKKMS